MPPLPPKFSAPVIRIKHSTLVVENFGELVPKHKIIGGLSILQRNSECLKLRSIECTFY